MLTKLVEFALTQRMLVAALTLLLIGVGIASYRDLPIDAFPDVSPTQVKIIMKAPGMTPEEVEARIVAPIELEMLASLDKTFCAPPQSMRSPTSPSILVRAPTSTGHASKSRNG